MRPIPQSLLDKIKKQNQTIYEGAEPKMSVAVARARSSIMDATYFTVETIRQKEGLGDIALALRRMRPYGYPDRIYEIHIDNGIAKTAYREYPDKLKEGWKTGFNLEAAKSVAIAFDGRWEYTIRKKWGHRTYEKPYIFWVTTAGNLYCQLWDEVGTKIKLAENVLKCSAIRGWKNAYLWNHDQGIVVAYIKTDNKIYYRNYCNQPPDQPALWELERVTTSSPNPAQNVSLFLTNDYRTGFMCESNGKLYWMITARNWANMAIPPHHIGASITDLQVDFVSITNDVLIHKHNLSTSINELKVMFCPAIYPHVTSIVNKDEATIRIKTNLPLFGDLVGLQTGFKVKDAMNNNFEVISTEKINDNLTLNCDNFLTAYGKLTVTYTFTKANMFALVDGGCEMGMSDFAIEFTPDFSDPVGSSAHNIMVALTDLIVDFINIKYTKRYHGHHVSAVITDLMIDFIHVDDINP